MNKLILAILTAAPLLCEAGQYSDFIKGWEGCKAKVYTDTQGKRTIGIGINLDDPSSRERLRGFNLSISKLLSGQELTIEQIDWLHKQEVASSLVIAKEVFPNFDSQPLQVREILVDLCFNLGENKILGFKKFKAAIEKKNYKLAAAELVNSKWYSQVGRRSKHHVEALKNVGQ